MTAEINNDLQIPWWDGKNHQEKLYWYNKLVESIPEIKNLPVATFDPEFTFYRLVNDGKIIDPTRPSGLDEIVGNLVNTETSKVRVATDSLYVKKNRQFLDIRDYGAVCDGIADDTVAVNTAIQAGAEQGIPVLFPSGREIGVFSLGVQVVNNSVIYANNAKLKGLGATGQFLLNIYEDVTIIGNITVEVNNSVSNNVRGALIKAGLNTGVTIAGALVIYALNPLAGEGDPYDQGLSILTPSKNVSIGRVSVKNFDYAFKIADSSNITINRIDIETFVRGLYINNVTELYVGSGEIKNKSANGKDMPGHNGVLIGADAHNSVDGLYLNNIVVRDSGEHGFRIGGNKQVSRVYFNKCSAINVGQCGFKVLGGTAADNNKHDTIYFLDCVVEDAGQTDSVSSGFMIQLASRVVISNPVVRKRNKPYSVVYGVEFQAVDGLQINNIHATDTKEAGIKLGFVLGDITEVSIDGGYVQSSSGDGLKFDYTNRTIRRVSVKNNIELNISGSGHNLNLIGTGGTSVGVSLMEWFSSVTDPARQINPAVTSQMTTPWRALLTTAFDPVAHASYFRNGSTWTENVSAAAIRHKVGGVWKVPAYT